MKIMKSLIINKPIDDVWEVLGNQFNKIDQWASLILKSNVSGNPTLAGVDYSIRDTQTTSGPTQQKLTAFDAKNFKIAYKATAGTPPFFKSVNAAWSLSKNGATSTQLILDFEVKFKGLFFILAPLVKIKLSKVGDELMDDLKYYVENGEPSIRKKNTL